MFPDFPELRSEFWAAFRGLMQKRITAYMDGFPRVHTTYFESKDYELIRGKADKEQASLAQLQAEIILSRQEMLDLTLEDVLRHLDALALQFAKQQADLACMAIEAGAEKVGNTTNYAGPKIAPDDILRMLAKMWIDFDARGNPKMPTIHSSSPEGLAALHRALTELEGSPSHRARLEEVLWEKERSGVHERLIENWLDSASERSYQAPFAQMLVALGHRVLHSTRHSPIELGVDLVTVSPEGEPCAYQLKGNPGRRLTLREFREIENQLLELLSLALPRALDIPHRRHRAVLVTNGHIEEEAQLAIERLNTQRATDGLPGKLEVIQRGDLLDWAKRLGSDLWPSELRDSGQLIELLVANGRGPLPIDKLHDLLAATLSLRDSDMPLKAAELKRRVASAALLTAIVLGPSTDAKNHYACASGWTLFATYVISACERSSRSFARNGESAVDLALAEIQRNLLNLAHEAVQSSDVIQGDPLTNFALYRARHTLVLSILSLLWLWQEDIAFERPPEFWDSLDRFLRSGLERAVCWGEGAIPQLVVYFWYLHSEVPGPSAEQLLEGLIATVLSTAGDPAKEGLASPYFSLQDVVRHRHASLVSHPWNDVLANEDTGSTTYFGTPLMHLLARTNNKCACKRWWPDLTRFLHIEMVPEDAWSYCLWHTTRGRYRKSQLSLPESWDSLRMKARQTSCDLVPDAMKARPQLLALFIILAPHRARPSVLRFLGARLDSTWFIESPISS